MPSGRGPGSGERWRRAALAVRERLPLWLETRCGLERRGLMALAVVLLIALAFAVHHFWSTRPEPVAVPRLVRDQPQAPVPGSGRDEAEKALPTAAGDGAEASTGASIVVDVSGKVRRPGIRTLPTGSRVSDALRAAGGVRPGASLIGLNQARVLTDGEQIVVGEPPPPGAPIVPGAVPPGGTALGAGTAPVSLNSATPDQLETLPGVGPVLAQHIVEYRTEHGGFRTVGELRNVSGIGDRRFADLQSLVQP